ncbi:YqaA family protein [Roseovarius arcticus]|uniref:YqaA family protein n=1 Tax=Roseovarius arcticus TaxID=2547404 RepID=UPI001110AE6C|nr:YqaA family protein [Roseovarius arcticus]
MMALSGLFLAAFLAATLIPAQSEAALVGLLWANTHPMGLLILVATVGNVLGSVVNWALGRYLNLFTDRRWFPVSATQMENASRWYQKWGYWSLLGSWLPVVGDPLTLAAGVLKEPLGRFLIIVTFAKAGRYLALAMATLQYL